MQYNPYSPRPKELSTELWGMAAGLPYPRIIVASNHLQGLHHESPKAMSKLSDTLIDSHLRQFHYQSRNKKSFLINCTMSVTHEFVYPKKKKKFNNSTSTWYTFSRFREIMMHLIVPIPRLAVGPWQMIGGDRATNLPVLLLPVNDYVMTWTCIPHYWLSCGASTCGFPTQRVGYADLWLSWVLGWKGFGTNSQMVCDMGRFTTYVTSL